MAHFTCDFISYTFKRAVEVNVIIPGPTSTDCESPECTHRPKYKYPVLYLLHGRCNDYSTWERYTSVERYAEERQIAVVTFSAENNMYVNLDEMLGKIGIDLMVHPNYEKFLIEELPDFVKAHFPVSDRPEDTYLAGLSMGGYGTLINGLKHKERFRAIGAFSPLTTLHRENLNADAEERLKPFEPLEVLKKALADKGKLPDIYYAYGDKDFLIECQKWFKDRLDELKVKYTFDLVEGLGHEWAFWDMELVRFLDFIPRTDEYYRECKVRRI